MNQSMSVSSAPSVPFNMILANVMTKPAPLRPLDVVRAEVGDVSVEDLDQMITNQYRKIFSMCLATAKVCGEPLADALPLIDKFMTALNIRMNAFKDECMAGAR